MQFQHHVLGGNVSMGSGREEPEGREEGVGKCMEPTHLIDCGLGCGRLALLYMLP